jgi:hypothetical protein
MKKDNLYELVVVNLKNLTDIYKCNCKKIQSCFCKIDDNKLNYYNKITNQLITETNNIRKSIGDMMWIHNHK